MSYDLSLFRPSDGRKPLEAGADEADLDDVNPGPIDPAAESNKKSLESALRATNTALETFPFDYAEIAKLLKVDEPEARRRWRHIEMNAPEGGNGIQITLFDKTASLTVPYWHGGEAARRVWEEIWTYLAVLQREGPFQVYDPQLDRVIDLDKDLPLVLGAYTGVDLTQITAPQQATPPKPWWKLW